MKKKIFFDQKSDIHYEMFFPEDSEKDLPLLIYLHGAGERGDDLLHLERHGIPKLISEGCEFPAVILCPQCPSMFVWDNIVRELKQLIDDVIIKFGIKKDRICITGSSMGGYGTWMMGLTYNNFFSAIAPVAGGSMSWRVHNLIKTPIYAIHGKMDQVVPSFYSEIMINEVLNIGGNAKLLLLEDMGHNDGIDYTYRNTDLIHWLLSQRRMNFDAVSETCSEFF